MEKIKERPILFKSEMVMAILSGHKTMTRRVIKGVPHGDHFGKDIMDWALSSCYTDEEGKHHLKVQSDVDDNYRSELFCPQGKQGDLLWVKENCRFHSKYDDTSPSKIPVGEVLSYCADEDENVCFQGKVRPSIFMLRWASRITLEITNVRIERLQEISEEDAKKEGIIERPFCFQAKEKSPTFDTAKDAFQWLWDSINGTPREGGKDISWEANPFVWCISFKKVDS